MLYLGLYNIHFFKSLTRNTAIEVTSTVKALHNETESLLVGRVSLVGNFDSSVVFFYHCLVTVGHGCDVGSCFMLWDCVCTATGPS